MPTKKKVETKTTTKSKTKNETAKEVKKAPSKKTAAKTTNKTATKKAPAKKTTTTKKAEKKPVNSIEKILTPTNSDNVILYNEKNEPMEFEQIALIPYEENLYCILHPVNLIDGIEQDEAIAFLINEDEDNIWLDIVDEEKTIDKIFDIYYDLLEGAQEQVK